LPEAGIHIIWNEFERPENPDLEIDIDNASPEQAVQRIQDLLNRLLVEQWKCEAFAQPPLQL